MCSEAHTSCPQKPDPDAGFDVWLYSSEPVGDGTTDDALTYSRRTTLPAYGSHLACSDAASKLLNLDFDFACSSMHIFESYLIVRSRTTQLFTVDGDQEYS